MLSSLFSQMPSAPAAPTGAASTSKSVAGEQVAGDVSSSGGEGLDFLQSLKSILNESTSEQAKDAKSSGLLPSSSEHDEAVSGEVSEDSELIDGEVVDGITDESAVESGSVPGAESELAVEGTSALDAENVDEANTPSDLSQVSDGLNVPSSSVGAAKAADLSVDKTADDSDSTDDAEQAVADVFAFLQHLSASSRQLADGESVTQSDVVAEITQAGDSPSEFSMQATLQVTGKDLPDGLSVSAESKMGIDSQASADGDALSALSRLLSGNFVSDKAVKGGDDSVIGKEASTDKELAAKIAASQSADAKAVDGKVAAQAAPDTAAKSDSTVSADLERALTRHKQPAALGGEAPVTSDTAANSLTADDISLLAGGAAKGEHMMADATLAKSEASLATQHLTASGATGSNRMSAESGQVANQQPPLQLSESQGHDELAERVQVMVSKNLKHVDIRLDPPELGKLQIKLSVNNDQANVQFTVANAQARDLVEHAMPRLREMLAQQGLQLAQGSVQQDDGRQSAGQFQQQAQQQQAQQGGAGQSGGRGHATNSGLPSGDGQHSTAEPASMWVSQPDDGVDYYA